MRRLIELSAIVADQKAQPRTAILVDKVAEYTEDMQRGDRFPPLVVFFDGTKYWLADGFHRYYAASGAEVASLACDVHDGTLRDAILYSCGANASHGLRRTNQDKQRAVAKLLEDPEWSHWSAEEIARRCAVSGDFVLKLKKDFLVTSDKGSEVTRVDKHGNVSTMNTANIGRKPREIEQQPSEIADTLEDIRRCIDFMPDPRAAVAVFPADKFYFFPLSELDEMAKWMADFAAAWRAQMEEKARAAAS